MPLSELKLNPVGEYRPKRKQHCTLCKNHDIKALKKGHECPYRECECELCKLGRCSRKIMCHQQRVWRHKKQKLIKKKPNADDQPGSPEVSETTQCCDRCRNHNKLEKKRNHTCPYVSCQCKFCSLTFKRQIQMMYQQRVRRSHVVSKTEEQRQQAKRQAKDDQSNVQQNQTTNSPQSPVASRRFSRSDESPERRKESVVCSGTELHDELPTRPPTPQAVNYDTFESAETSCDSNSSRMSHNLERFRQHFPALATKYLVQDDYEHTYPISNRQVSMESEDAQTTPQFHREIKMERYSPEPADSGSMSEYGVETSFSAIRSINNQMSLDHSTARLPTSFSSHSFVERRSLGEKFGVREEELYFRQLRAPIAASLGSNPYRIPLSHPSVLQAPRLPFNYSQNFQQRLLLPSGNTYSLGMPHNPYPWMEYQDRW